MDKLPLKIRVDIRDIYEPESSSVHKAVEVLNSTLGKKIAPEVEWVALWAQSQDEMTDKAAFVPSVISQILTWYDRLTVRLDNDQEGEWTDGFLEILKNSKGQIRLYVQPAPEKTTRPTTVWASSSNIFMLYLPKISKTQAVSTSQLFQALDDDFHKVVSGTGSDQISDAIDGWADVETGREVSSKPAPQKPLVLPSLDSLPHPSRLLNGVASPFLVVNLGGSDGIVIRSTNQPAMELLKDYLLKWAKKDAGDKKIKIELRDSDFCFGMIDSLYIGPSNKMRPFEINPTLVLAFVEEILGYKLVDATSSRFMYRIG
jgi:hypothetical protein